VLISETYFGLSPAALQSHPGPDAGRRFPMSTAAERRAALPCRPSTEPVPTRIGPTKHGRHDGGPMQSHVRGPD
jgi:hypothetical protein